MMGFYLSNTSELKTGSPNRGAVDSTSSRYEGTTEEMLRNKMARIQQNYASVPTQNIKSQRSAVGKSGSIRNSIQMKLKTINSHNSNFDSFENLNLNNPLQQNYALPSSKPPGGNNHIFSVTQTIKSPQRESFQANSHLRNGTQNNIQNLTGEYIESSNGNKRDVGVKANSNRIQ